MANLTLKHTELYSRRFGRYVEQTQLGRAAALGKLLFFWDATRSAQIVRADRDTLVGHIDGELAQQQRVFEALLSAGYLQADSGGFVIWDNARALAFTQQRRASAHKGGISRRDKLAAKPKARPRRAKAAPAPAPAPARTPLAQACHDTWLSYAQAYEQRTTRPPLRNQKVNSQIKQLVQRVGFDIAPQLVRFYVLRVTDAYYVKNFWPLGPLLAQAEGFVTQFELGGTVSTADVQQASATSDYHKRQQRLWDVAAGLERKGVFS